MNADRYAYNDCYLVTSGFDEWEEGKGQSETWQNRRWMNKVGAEGRRKWPCCGSRPQLRAGIWHSQLLLPYVCLWQGPHRPCWASGPPPCASVYTKRTLSQLHSSPGKCAEAEGGPANRTGPASRTSGWAELIWAWLAGEVPEGFAVGVGVLEAHLLQLTAAVEFIVPAVRLLA